MIIQAENIGKKFGANWIFKNYSLKFQKGYSYALTGKNGSGKSTFIKILMGNFLPSKGNIYYFDTLNKRIEPEAFYKNLVFCSPYNELIEEFTGKELYYFHIHFKNITLPFKEFFDQLGLAASANKPIEQYSSGMKQKLQLGLAFFNTATCLFLDEPSSNLDEANKDWYLKTVQSIKKEKLLVIASNDKNEYSFCDHSIKLD